MKAKFYQVGGSVRDEFLGVKSKDIDYAVECPSYDAMKQAIIELGGEIFLETPDKFTIRANVPKLGACDYVLCRKDGAYSDGRRPDSVSIGTIYDDLARRDFTVNAIAKDPYTGEIIDPHNGRADLERKLLICVGSINRLHEDSLRMLRAIRFAITKGLVIDDSIHIALQSEHIVSLMANLPYERVRDELYKCFHFNTRMTLEYLIKFYPIVGRYALDQMRLGIWLKPTNEKK